MSHANFMAGELSRHYNAKGKKEGEEEEEEEERESRLARYVRAK